MLHQLVLLLILTSLSLNKSHDKKTHSFDGAKVKTSHGVLQGKVDKTKSGMEYFSFQGIPYAKPPVKNLRFEPPENMNWNGIWNATYTRNTCTQFDSSMTNNESSVVGDEDCLYMNIYTVKLPSKGQEVQASVLVWIHGGAFLVGAGEMPSTGFGSFIDRKVVVVSVNYRLGVFGFLSTGDNVVPGNMAVKDLIQALHWIQQNIANFGGNPKNVTIMGESAGGALVSFLTQIPSTKGLFHQGIMESGNTYLPWATSKTAREATLLLGKKVGIQNRDIKEIIKKLKALPTEKLHFYSYQVMIKILLKDPLNGFVYAPVLEPNNSKGVLVTKTEETFKSCNINSVPIIVGINSAEGDFFKFDKILLSMIYFAGLDLKPERMVPLDIQAAGKCSADDVGRKIKDHYVGRFGSFAISGEKFTKYITDYMFIAPTLKYVKSYLKCNPNVYFYRFSYTGGRSEGAGHTDELLYLFDANLMNKTEEDWKMSNNINKLWTNFIKTGHPTPEKSEFGVTWIRSSQQNDYSYLEIDSKLSSMKQSDSPHRKDIAFWNNLYATCGKNVI